MESAALGQRWNDFQRWRRGRPFWSGLLLVLSGIELWLSSNMDLGALQVHLGYEGFLSYVLPAVMVVCGLLVWISPGQRLFYGIVGGLTAIFSLIGLNLGGWFVGLLIGVVGGALAVAWTPVSTVDESGPPVEDPDTIVRTPVPRHGRDDLDDEEDGSRGSGTTGRLFAIMVPVLLLAGGLAVAVAPPSQAATAAAPCAVTAGAAAAAPPTITAPPTPTATAPTATASPTRAPTLLELWLAFWEKVFGKNAPKPTAFPTGPPPTLPPTPAQTPGATPTCDPTGPAPGTTGGPAPALPTATGEPSPSPTAAPAAELAAVDGQPVVSDHPAHMTTSTLSLFGFAFDGVTSLPTTGGGTIRVLRFSIDRATNANFQLLIEKDGQTVAIRSDPLVVSGQVKLYTSRFSGSLLGIPLTFTPDAPPPLTLPIMVFTNVSLELVFLDCGSLEGPSLAIS